MRYVPKRSRWDASTVVSVSKISTQSDGGRCCGGCPLVLRFNGRAQARTAISMCSGGDRSTPEALCDGAAPDFLGRPLRILGLRLGIPATAGYARLFNEVLSELSQCVD